MKMTIQEIWEYYRDDLKRAEEKISESMEMVAPAIKAVGNHLIFSGGKRIRPFLAILAAKLFDFSGERVGELACSVECIHAASLLHDDVVDGASIRRGKPAAHSLWSNQVVILVGDFLYANALRLANLLKSQEVMDALCAATAKMSEGELIQLSKKGSPDMTEPEYMKIIMGKTAILMSAACKGGAVLGSGTDQQVEALSTFGLKFGFAFQIADDILDYMAEEVTLGKSLGKDLEEGKITLPLIYLLREAEEEEAHQVREIVRSDRMSETDLAYIRHLFRKHKSIEQSHERASTLLSEAKAALDIFEDSRAKNALLTISDYVLTRKK